MIFLPVFLYAETHYRFKYFFSFLKKSEPEILTDAPYRLDPNKPLPILLLTKDTHIYPIEIISVQITLQRNGQFIHSEIVQPDQPIHIETKYWWRVIELHFKEELSEIFGHLDVHVEITIKRNGKIKTILNNNHRTSTKKPLNVYRSRTSLPSMPGWIYGDVHTHSTYTDDQVEFGSPIGASPALCTSMGLSFFCVTDHSYDLDDTIDSYLENDPTIPKWKLLQSEVTDTNQQVKDFAVIRGEEVSCENSDGSTVHLLLFGTRKFFPGSGDGAEKWFHTTCEHTVPSVLNNKELSVAAYAGHPTESVPFLQSLLLNRGEWTKGDMASAGLDGIQILNGEHSDNFHNGLDVWKWLLLKGEKKFIAAGNDAHGNFNRFIQIGIPFFMIREKKSQLFGKMKTALFSLPNENAVVSALKQGHSVITNGPLFVIEIETDRNGNGKIGDTVHGDAFILKIKGASSVEFGHFTSVVIYIGTIGKKEKVLFEQKYFSDPFAIHLISDWETLSAFSYIRAEGFTSDGKGTDRDGFCYTNPIWISTE
ncbi:MAG: hypothetical protein HYV29_02445 [Ignavibacteriales bacterium]|nr:hypothetical protein [Ignavibacteriales bacterium]